MLQLGQAVLEQVMLGIDELFPLVHTLLEEYRRWLVLEARHLKGLHYGLIVISRSASLAVRV